MIDVAPILSSLEQLPVHQNIQAAMDIKRPDGRLPNELRDIIVSFDGLHGVDGSARFGFGETKALASVSGPMEVRLAAEQASKATFEVLVRPLTGLPGTEAKSLASSLRCALLPSLMLTNNPRTLVQLVAQSLTSITPSAANLNDRKAATLSRTGPALVAALINAASLALVNASSIPLRGVVCAASVGRLRDSYDLIVDPAEGELASLDGSGTFAFLITSAKPESDSAQAQLKADMVWSSWNANSFDESELARVVELAQAGAFHVRDSMKDAVSLSVFGPVRVKIESKESGSAALEPLDDEKMEIP